jgi:hypothetical protein
VAVRGDESIYVLPRAYVVAWEAGDKTAIHRLAMALRRAGYVMATRAAL